MPQRIEYGTDSAEWKWWDGDLLTGTVERPIAFDTETELIEGPLHWPRIALAMAFDGKRLLLIHPDRIGDFLAAHRKAHLVAHNVVFDWWVCHEHLKGRVEQRLLWDSAKADRWHCTMILNQLLQLATGNYSGANGGGGGGDEKKLYPANISVACETEGLPPLAKDDPYRLRFGELLLLTAEQMEAHPEFGGFVSYALKDVIAAYRLYERQRIRAKKIVDAVGECPHQIKGGYQIIPGAFEKWGPLTEAIQVKGAIVLEEMSRHPLPIDQVERQRLEDEARLRYQSAFESLLAEAPLLFKRFAPKSKRAGQIKTTARSLVPQMDNGVLKETLQRIADEKGLEAPQSDGKLKGISTSAKAWAKFAHQHRFIADWIDLEDWAKHLEFLRTIDSPVIYSRYSLLMRTGRTSASAHRQNKKLVLNGCNVQQLPREGDFRSLFVAPPGKVYAAIDFSFIEIRTLAASTAARYGYSKMKDAILEHAKGESLDPHHRTAASILGLDDDEYKALPKDAQKAARQKAKACFHRDVEILTARGYVKVSELSYADFVVQYDPEAGRASFTEPLALTRRESQPLYILESEGRASPKMRVTPDHRMLVLRVAVPTVVEAKDLRDEETVLLVEDYVKWFGDDDIKVWTSTLTVRFRKRMLDEPQTVYCLSVPSSFVIARNDPHSIPMVISQCNFGFPGGLGVDKFRAYAEASYGVHFSAQEAKEGKRKWLDRYDEMKLWLSDRTAAGLRYQLGGGVDRVLKRLSSAGLRLVNDLLRQVDQSPRKSEAAWSILEEIVTAAKRWDLLEAVNEREITPALSKICLDYVTTLTGRVRANTGYTEINTAFQGCAADGAKLALFEARYRGFKPAIFVHDEAVWELDEDEAAKALPKLCRIMNEQMESVLDGVPSAVEGEVAKCWQKP